MTLPIKVVDINSATWSDHKNQIHGGALSVLKSTDSDDNGASYQLGNSAEYAGYIEPGISGGEGHKIIRFHAFLQRVGSPSGNVFVEVYDAGGSAPNFSSLLAKSQLYPASSIPTSGKTEVVFSFPAPATQAVSGTRAIMLRISVQGDVSNYIKVFKRTQSGSHAGSRPYGSSTWTDDVDLELSNIIEVAQTGAIVVALDKPGTGFRAYKTIDNGTTWTQQSGNPSTSSTAGLQTLAGLIALQDMDMAHAILKGGSNNVSFQNVSQSGSPGWHDDISTAVTFTSFGTNVSGTAPLGGGRRANGNAVVVAQGATETVMGSARRRIKLTFWNSSSWSGLFDVQGSTNTPDATLPGDAVHYDLRWAAVDANGDCHIVYSRSDSSTLQYRKFKSDNTFATINTLNGAVASATANYPVGQPAFYYQSPDWYVAIPYVDNTSNTLKVARCKTTITETSANWTSTEIVAASAEVTGSNPAVLMADNGQGGKLFCVRVVPTTKGLKFTNDSGSNTWIAETDWKGGTQVIGGISGFYIEDGIALVYLEEGTTPDELRYDRL